MKDYNYINIDLTNEVNRIIIMGERRNKLVKVCEYPSELLIQIGLEKVPILMYETHICSNILKREEAIKKGYNKNRDWHGIGKYNFIKAIRQLDNPTAIFRWKNNNKNNYNDNDYIILTEITGNFEDKDSRIIIPFTVEKVGDCYRIKSIYGKRNIFKYLNDNIKNNSMERIYINKSTNNFGKGQSQTENTNAFIKNSISS